MLGRRSLIGFLAAMLGIAVVLLVAYPAGSKSPARTKPHSATIIIHFYDEYAHDGITERRSEEGPPAPLRITRLSPGKAFSIETHAHTVDVAPGKYGIEPTKGPGGSPLPHPRAQRVTVRQGQRKQVAFITRLYDY